jgi:hypothetical protein
MVIFKGKENGRIVTKELPTYSSECIWAAQKNAWCDERCMMMWVDGCLKPWKEELAATLGPIMPILILDAYRVHMMASVVNYIQGLQDTQLFHFPPILVTTDDQVTPCDNQCDDQVTTCDYGRHLE